MELHVSVRMRFSMQAGLRGQPQVKTKGQMLTLAPAIQTAAGIQRTRRRVTQAIAVVLPNLHSLLVPARGVLLHQLQPQSLHASSPFTMLLGWNSNQHLL
jgi:hypothetical protein